MEKNEFRAVNKYIHMKNLTPKEIKAELDNVHSTSASVFATTFNRMGSIKFPHLSNLARRIWEWCARRDIFIYASYIPSAQNFEADAKSRVVSEETEWSIGQAYFDRIEVHFGRFDIDLFASSINAKCFRFVSWLPDPRACRIDAFAMSWDKLYFYAFPPFILIARVLRKIITDRAEGVLVVPWWPTQP
ncbi:hypothetical protein ALC62_11563 [Cyphomyrmex costatus]|uniref:Uncharacterized protein n=1 Tax=Cyphomyrmex costatus TaxID=456900 RepID=A0A151ICD5_9HYME|nr:hypothetical protein ALC62_11563 [Cyphomyrmex costatus]